MQLTLTIDREDDGRWIVEVPEAPASWITARRARSDGQSGSSRVRCSQTASRWRSGNPSHISIVLPAAACLASFVREHCCKRCYASDGRSNVKPARHCVLNRSRWADYVFSFHSTAMKVGAHARARRGLASLHESAHCTHRGWARAHHSRPIRNLRGTLMPPAAA